MDREKIEKLLGYSFKDKKLLTQAFTHSSYVNEHKEKSLEHNERLEFLGDNVLNLIAANFLYTTFEELPEGQLSSLRSILVSSASCSIYIEQLGVVDHLLLGKGELLHGLSKKSTVYADLFEAILGAIYLDGGLESARTFFMHHFQPLLFSLTNNPEQNWKALLQEQVQKQKKIIPRYTVLNEIGPDHSKQFTVGIYIEDSLIATGEGKSKKEAEAEAAEKAFHILYGDLL